MFFENRIEIMNGHLWSPAGSFLVPCRSPLVTFGHLWSPGSNGLTAGRRSSWLRDGGSQGFFRRTRTLQQIRRHHPRDAPLAVVALLQADDAGVLEGDHPSRLL